MTEEKKPTEELLARANWMDWEDYIKTDAFKERMEYKRKVLLEVNAERALEGLPPLLGISGTADPQPAAGQGIGAL